MVVGIILDSNILDLLFRNNFTQRRRISGLKTLITQKTGER